MVGADPSSHSAPQSTTFPASEASGHRNKVPKTQRMTGILRTDTKHSTHHTPLGPKEIQVRFEKTENVVLSGGSSPCPTPTGVVTSCTACISRCLGGNPPVTTVRTGLPHWPSSQCPVTKALLLLCSSQSPHERNCPRLTRRAELASNKSGGKESESASSHHHVGIRQEAAVSRPLGPGAGTGRGE